MSNQGTSKCMHTRGDMDSHMYVHMHASMHTYVHAHYTHIHVKKEHFKVITENQAKCGAFSLSISPSKLHKPALRQGPRLNAHLLCPGVWN